MDGVEPLLENGEQLRRLVTSVGVLWRRVGGTVIDADRRRSHRVL
jgi:hypothetical protein